MTDSLSPTVLIVDNDQLIRRSLQVNLTQHGYAVEVAESAEEALVVSSRVRPSAVIIDLLLPGMSGMELIQHIRRESSAPILVLTVIGDEQKKIEALEGGADDYLTKPFGLDELLARMRALLRRTSTALGLERTYVCGELSVNVDRREVRMKTKLLKLTPTEYDLLMVMVQNANKLVTHRTLLKTVWGPAYEGETTYLRVFVGQLRKKIETTPAQPRYILTEPGVGYRLVYEEK